MSDVLHTLAAPCQHEQEIRKSRFLAWAAPVQDPQQALHWLATTNPPDASHHCWAYRIGNQYRFHDDGEPGRTAGRPILRPSRASAWTAWWCGSRA